MALLFLVFISSVPFVANAFVCSSGAPKSEAEVLQVHIVPHTHDDVGWLKTVDEYYYGANNSIQMAGVQYILDSVIPALVENPERRFIYVEIAFFKRWFDEQNPAMQLKVGGLVASGQLEFINGGWSMNDEATTHYNAIIDQMTHGLSFISENFGGGARPRVAWHIDPFGHSAEQASLFAQMSFEGFFFARIHYADMAKRVAEKRMELMWRGSASLGNASEIFTGILYHGYGPPGGFSYDIFSGDPPIQDDPTLFGYNVKERVELFVKRSCEQASHYKSGHVMLTMGSDFNYQNANTWFKNLDKLINYANKDGRLNTFYSTPSKYLDAVKNMDLELKTDDFFPYADCPHCYWTGYFTSRPSLKGYVRKSNNLLQICKQLEVLANFKTSNVGSFTLRDAMGVAQHHDAVSGTEKQHVAFDYAKRLAIGTAECQIFIGSALNKLSERVHSEADIKFTFCDYLNISACAATATLKSFSISVFNPIARFVDTIVRVPVQNSSVMVYGPNGKPVSADVLPVSRATSFVRGNLGNAPCELVFRAERLPPLGFVTYKVNITSGRKHPGFEASLRKSPEKNNGDYIIENEHLRLTFSADTGRLVEMENLETSLTQSVDQQFFWYNSSIGNQESKQASGAYIFRPNSSKATTISYKNHAKITVLKLDGVQEIRQVFSPWVSQVVRLYKNAPYAEFEYTVGPIKDAPIPKRGKEVISRFDTTLKTKGVFYTDANGREMQKRTRNFRPTWKYNDTEPVAGNYYPVNSRAYIRDDDSGVQFTVLTDRSLGGSSMRDGSLEIMVHRRLLKDDRRGVGEALNEPGRDGRGLIVRGRFLVLLEAVKASARLHRVLGEEEMLRPLLGFATGSTGGGSYQALTRPLPINVHLLTLEQFEHVVLLRLEHQFAIGEDDELSKPVVVQLKGLFKYFRIVSLTELNLAANQVIRQRPRKSENEVDWREAMLENSIPVRFNDDGDYNVSLNAMEIRTFKIDVEWK